MKAARQQAIVDLLITHSSLTTETLSKQLNVSRETIRRDLSELQAQGKVLRNHGRAKVIHQRSQDSGDPFHMRLKSHYAHKADIAREALAWIDEGMVIALDASSTCWYLARQLPDRPLHVFTNSQPICQELANRDQTVTPQQVFDAVCHMRMTKLPDPKINGNAGSFFKNPIVSAQVAEALLAQFPHAPHYPQANGSVKLAAGWLIDQCQLKGKRIGGAAVHRQQALVLINEDQATSEDVIKLAHYVRQQVGAKFNVWLQPEVRFIGTHGEVNAEESIA